MFKKILRVFGIVMLGLAGLVLLITTGIFFTGGFEKKIIDVTSVNFEVQQYVISDDSYIKILPNPIDATELDVEIIVISGGDVVELPETGKIGENILVTVKQIEKLDPNTDEPILDEDGNPVMINVGGMAEIEIRTSNLKTTTCEIVVDVPIEEFEADIQVEGEEYNGTASIYMGDTINLSVDETSVYPEEALNPTDRYNSEEEIIADKKVIYRALMEYPTDSDNWINYDMPDDDLYASEYLPIINSDSGEVTLNSPGSFRVEMYLFKNYEDQFLLNIEDYMADGISLEDYYTDIAQYCIIKNVEFEVEGVDLNEITYSINPAISTNENNRIVIDVFDSNIYTLADLGIELIPTSSNFESSDLEYRLRDLVVTSSNDDVLRVEKNSGEYAWSVTALDFETPSEIDEARNTGLIFTIDGVSVRVPFETVINSITELEINNGQAIDLVISGGNNPTFDLLNNTTVTANNPLKVKTYSKLLFFAEEDGAENFIEVDQLSKEIGNTLTGIGRGSVNITAVIVQTDIDGYPLDSVAGEVIYAVDPITGEYVTNNEDGSPVLFPIDKYSIHAQSNPITVHVTEQLTAIGVELVNRLDKYLSPYIQDTSEALDENGLDMNGVDENGFEKEVYSSYTVYVFNIGDTFQIDLTPTPSTGALTDAYNSGELIISSTYINAVDVTFNYDEALDTASLNVEITGELENEETTIAIFGEMLDGSTLFSERIKINSGKVKTLDVELADGLAPEEDYALTDVYEVYAVVYDDHIEWQTTAGTYLRITESDITFNPEEPTTKAVTIATRDIDYRDDVYIDNDGYFVFAGETEYNIVDGQKEYTPIAIDITSNDGNGAMDTIYVVAKVYDINIIKHYGVTDGSNFYVDSEGNSTYDSDLDMLWLDNDGDHVWSEGDAIDTKSITGDNAVSDDDIYDMFKFNGSDYYVDLDLNGSYDSETEFLWMDEDTSLDWTVGDSIDYSSIDTGVASAFKTEKIKLTTIAGEETLYVFDYTGSVNSSLFRLEYLTEVEAEIVIKDITKSITVEIQDGVWEDEGGVDVCKLYDSDGDVIAKYTVPDTILADGKSGSIEIYPSAVYMEIDITINISVDNIYSNSYVINIVPDATSDITYETNTIAGYEAITTYEVVYADAIIDFGNTIDVDVYRVEINKRTDGSAYDISTFTWSIAETEYATVIDDMGRDATDVDFDITTADRVRFNNVANSNTYVTVVAKTSFGFQAYYKVLVLPNIEITLDYSQGSSTVVAGYTYAIMPEQTDMNLVDDVVSADGRVSALTVDGTVVDLTDSLYFEIAEANGNEVTYTDIDIDGSDITGQTKTYSVWEGIAYINTETGELTALDITETIGLTIKVYTDYGYEVIYRVQISAI